MMNQFPYKQGYQPDGTPLQPARRPWGVFLLLMVVFFITQHDFFYSLIEHYSPVPEEYAEQVYEGSPLRRTSLILLGIYGFFSLTRRWGSPLKINGVQGWVIIGYIIWSILSLTWSINTMLTLRRLVLFSMLCLASLAVARRFSYRDFIVFVFITGAVYSAIGLFAEFSLGTFRPWISWYRFSGTAHPNTQSINGAMLYLSSIFLYRTAGRRGRHFYTLVAVFAVLLMVLTKSRTATTAAVLAPVAFWSLNLRKTHKFLVLSTVIIIVTTVALFRDVAVPALQQSVQMKRHDVSVQSDATLTGRVPLWEDLITYINRHPVTGYGYGAFWIPEHIMDIAAVHAWAPNEGHSSYIDRMLELGYPGMLVFVMVFVFGIRRAYLFKFRYGIDEYGFIGSLLIFCMLDSLLESIVLHPNIISFVSMVALAHLGFQDPEELRVRRSHAWV